MNRMIRSVQVVSVSATLALSACGGFDTDPDRQEVLDRLRALGAQASTLVQTLPKTPGALASLTLFAALPEGATLSAQPQDAPFPRGQGLPLKGSQVSVDPLGITYEDHKGFRLARVKVSAQLPTASAMARFDDGGGEVWYRVDLVSGERTERVEGAFLAYPEGAAPLQWQAPVLTLANPTAGARTALYDGVNLKLAATNPVQELLLPGWFVPGGLVRNRRSSETVWFPKEAGSYTVIATVRGRDTLGFDLKVVDVTVE